MAPSAHKRYKKFDKHLQESIKTAARKLSVDPYRCEELKGPLKGLRSYHFTYNKIYGISDCLSDCGG
ncbi:MAG: type II toxin-antitoxin system RelE/ParE family toxin [Candidatus Methanospirareceae archaeon]